MNYIYFNQKYFAEKPEYNNDNVLLIPEPWLAFKNRFVQILCHAHLSPRINSVFGLPLKKIWIPGITKCSFSKDDSICVIINAHFYDLMNAGIQKYLKGNYKSAYFVFQFSDRVDYFRNNYDSFPSIDKLKMEYDLIMTYNIEDSKRYKITLERPCVPKIKDISNKLPDYSSDLFFVGKNKGRIETIHNIYKICQDKGLRCDFHVMDVLPKDQKYKDTISYNTPIPYMEVLERASKTKCILNIIQENGAGVTLRDYEAIQFNKLMLTNNTALKETGLYRKDQMIWINELGDRIEEIQKGFQGKSNLKNEYSQEKWYTWLEETLKNNHSCTNIL